MTAQVRVGDEFMQLEGTVAEQLVDGVTLVLGMDVIHCWRYKDINKKIEAVSAKQFVLRRRPVRSRKYPIQILRHTTMVSCGQSDIWGTSEGSQC